MNIMKIDLHSLDPALEGLLLSSDDISFNFNKWKADKVKILYVVGFSGSGKTTTAKKIAEEYGVELIETDGWMSDHPNMSWDKKVSTLIEYIKARKKVKQRTIIEGIMMVDLFAFNENVFDCFEDTASIAKGTSFVKSTWRALFRDAPDSKHSWWKHLKSRYKTNKAFLKEYERFITFLNDGMEISPLSDKVRISKSKIHGKGVICSIYIEATELICRAFMRIDTTGVDDNDWDLSDIAHAINHSNSPNVKLINNSDKTRYAFMAIKNIKKGEELTVDYNVAPDFVEKPSKDWK